MARKQPATKATATVHPAPDGSLFDLPAAIKKLDPDFVQCRDYGHSWRPFHSRWVPRENHYEQILRCGRCETERTRYLGKRGQMLSSKYEYATGYLWTGAGRLTTDDRDMIRLASVKLTEVEDRVKE